MLIARFILLISLLSPLVLGAGVSYGQTYPNKSIRVVTTGVGSDNDFMARLIAQGVSASLGQQLIVENRASGVALGEIVSKAPPDGYTLLMYGSTFWIGSLLQNTPYDPVKDFSPISMVARGHNVLVVHPSVAANSVKELIALAKAKPGALNYASGGTGGSGHLAAELFKAMTGINIVRVPFTSGSLRMAALLSGEVQMEFASTGSVASQVKAGKLRVLAVTSAQPSALAPGVPTMAAFVPGYEQASTNGMLAPAKTPAAIISRLNQEILRFLNQPDAKQKFFDFGVETVGSSPEEFAVAIKSEMARLGKVIKDAGIRAD